MSFSNLFMQPIKDEITVNFIAMCEKEVYINSKFIDSAFTRICYNEKNKGEVWVQNVKKFGSTVDNIYAELAIFMVEYLRNKGIEAFNGPRPSKETLFNIRINNKRLHDIDFSQIELGLEVLYLAKALRKNIIKNESSLTFEEIDKLDCNPISSYVFYFNEKGLINSKNTGEQWDAIYKVFDLCLRSTALRHIDNNPLRATGSCAYLKFRVNELIQTMNVWNKYPDEATQISEYDMINQIKQLYLKKDIAPRPHHMELIRKEELKREREKQNEDNVIVNLNEDLSEAEFWSIVYEHASEYGDNH